MLCFAGRVRCAAPAVAGAVASEAPHYECCDMAGAVAGLVMERTWIACQRLRCMAEMRGLIIGGAAMLALPASGAFFPSSAPNNQQLRLRLQVFVLVNCELERYVRTHS